jgi:endoglucanase
MIFMNSILFLVLTACINLSDPGSPLDNQDNNDTIGGQGQDTVSVVDDSIAWRRNLAIGKGMNIGNALEAPNEGEWGLVIKQSYIQAIGEAGFNSVRLPICWPAHTSAMAPYSIDPAFIERVDEVMEWCFDEGMTVIITIHHFNELYDHPLDETYRNMFFAIWDQLTEHYLGTSGEILIFELLNEPHSNMTAEIWNDLIPEILGVVRDIDTNRTLIIDAPDWAYHGAILKLEIPEEEQNVIVSVRYYLPYDFTHQGAHWAEGSDAWLGTTWTGTANQKNTVLTDMELVKEWSEQHNRPVTVGEYGAIVNAAHEDRITWTRYVRSRFEANGFSWSYFDFGVYFRAYDTEHNEWLEGFPGVFFD